MRTRVLSAADPELALLLASGGIVAFPTESYYGLAAIPWDPVAVGRLVSEKGERDQKPIALALASTGAVLRVASRIPDPFEVLARQFWPGPLTLIVAARDDLAAPISAGTGTVGVRVSGHPIARALAGLAGGAITATSANRSGEPPACRVDQVLASFGGRIEAVIDGGETAGGPPSTLLDLTSSPARILRHGATPVAALSAWLALG